ncbi:hypothetical protein DE146DRAFT_231086 [Phaeosphaeria sp. MPI-PUGE-AT-0046c]|nr:hypothetical protein DE146DRAFT_231086 [Phaeosphaeria sp. MPI-PUGE-AT-0046c]
MICPGRFPSPMTSREASPVPFTENSVDLNFLHTRTYYRTPTLDFTASISCRKRPYFADTQSEPVVSKVSKKPPTSPHLTARYHTHGRRTVSDSASSPPRYSIQPGIHKTNRQTYQRRIASAQSSPPSPPSPPRPTSAPPVHIPVSDSSYIVDVRLRDKLRSPLTSHDIAPLFGASKRGSIYVLFDPLRPQRGTKIGWTLRADYTKRIAEHRSTCGFVPKVIHVSHDVHYSHRAEQLVHLELMDRRSQWSCMGHKTTATKHGEWFDISHVEAKEIVEKWARFMNSQKPYNWTRQISPVWEYLLRKRTLVMNTGFGHDERREQWRRMLGAPTQGERVFFGIDVLLRIGRAARDIARKNWPYCVAYFWQMLTLVYSFATLLVCRNAFASSAFAVVSVCAYLSIWSKLPLKRVRSKSC